MPTAALQLEQWPIGRLVEYERNPRRNDDVVERMAQAIVEFGFRIPIVARSDGLVVDGHLRLKAARLLGLDTVPVVLADELSETQIKAFRLLANQSANWAEWDEFLLSAELQELLAEDFDLSLVGFSDGELDRLLSMDPDAGSDEEAGAGGSAPPVTIPEPPRNPASRTGDLWILGDHRLLCGDSTSAADAPPDERRARGAVRDRSALSRRLRRLEPSDPQQGLVGVLWHNLGRQLAGRRALRWVHRRGRGRGDHRGCGLALLACVRRQAMLAACWEKAGAFVHQQIIWVKDRGVLTRSHYL
ncbi:MAG: ParB N-terminal domain-containing protein [Paracoccaceae bacterium]